MTVERTAQGALVIETQERQHERRPTFDPVALTVVDNYLTSCCRDMGVTMMTTAYSPIFNESLDFSCVIFDPQGNMLAQAEFCPSPDRHDQVHGRAGRSRSSGSTAFEPGDVVLHNDPYRGSGHVPEHMLLKPVFCDGEIFAFVANVAHMSEVGREDAGRALRRRDRGLPGGPAAAAGEDQAARRGRRRHLEDHPLQPPHAEGDARRLPRDDGLARPRRDAASTS